MTPAAPARDLDELHQAARRLSADHPARCVIEAMPLQMSMADFVGAAKLVARLLVEAR